MREIERKVLGWIPVVHVVVQDRVEVFAGRISGQGRHDALSKAWNVRRDLVSHVSTDVDEGGEHVVGTMQFRVNGEEKDHGHLVQEHEKGFDPVEAVSSECIGCPRFVVHVVHVFVQGSPVQQPVGPVEPGVVD